MTASTILASVTTMQTWFWLQRTAKSYSEHIHTPSKGLPVSFAACSPCPGELAIRSLSHPAKQFCSPKSYADIIYMNDEAIVLEHLLRMVGGLPLLPITGDVVESILHAAETYEMPGPISIIRLAVTSSPLADDPLRMYTICSRYEWEEELKFFSTRSLAFNLHDPSYSDVLQRLNSRALLRLFALHRSRRERYVNGLPFRGFHDLMQPVVRLRGLLNEPPFVTGGPAVCIQCQARIEYQTWRELKYRIILEIDERPLGDTIGHGLNMWPEAIACWQAQCPNGQCQRRLYDKSESIRAIQQRIDELPLTV
jgi:hypothetical protein